MGSHSLPVDSDPANPDWHEIEDLLDELAEFARSTRSAAEFYRLLLERIVPAVSASGGAVWSASRGGELCLEYQLALLDSPGAGEPEALARHQEIVEQVLCSGQPSAVPAPFVDNKQSHAKQAECWVALHPFRIGPQESGVIELLQRRATTLAQRSGYLRVLAAACELTDDFHRHRELGQLRRREEGRGEFEQFALRIHGSLDVTETAYAIANEGRRVIGCDRLSVVIRRGGTCRAAAMSGVDVLDRRAKLVRALEALVNRCAAAGEPLWYGDDSADVPEEIERPLQAYLDESHARALAAVPLFAAKTQQDRVPGQIIGILVAEQFHVATRDAELRDRLSTIAGHSGAALANSLAYSHMPLARLGRLLARVRWLAEPRQLPKTMFALALVGATAAGLALIPADFDIEARGELQPEVRREVFASDDGVVSELLVDQGQVVGAEQPLVVLRNPNLDLEIRRVAGEIQTAEKKLAAVQAERLSNDPTPDDRRRDAHQLTADEEELKESLKGLAQQREILEQQRKDLVVRSPIAGQALTWNLRELLAARPVERGQSLLTVADLEGPWVAQLRVEDHRAGHVLAAREKLQPDLAVSFALASDPGTKYPGRISDVALATETEETEESTVLVKVGFDRRDVAHLRPGATVLAKIHCGRRALGYVWLHDLFELVQSHLWW